MLAPHIRGKRVLDAGCGNGCLSRLLSDAGARVTGIDFSQQMVNMAKSLWPDLSFAQCDLLNLDRNLGQFDVICGTAVLHEIDHANTPKLIDVLDGHLAPNGFGFFQENSFFNPAFRFVRRHLVGRYGIPKRGSEEESPFDVERLNMYKERFRYCERSAEVFVLFARFHQYIIRSPWEGPWDALDKTISRSRIPDLFRRNFSYIQHIYFSHSCSRASLFLTR
jgi:SAM-dependent methyltransferase